MPTVAEQLRGGREALKLNVQQVVEATKLKTDQVRALEDGNHEYFTAAVYLRGSVRTYANLVGLDSSEVLAQLDAELAATKKFTDQSFTAGKSKSGLDSLMLLFSRMNWIVAAFVVVLLVAVLVGNTAYRAWKGRRHDDPFKSLSSGLYRPSTESGEYLALPTNAPRRAP